MGSNMIIMWTEQGRNNQKCKDETESEEIFLSFSQWQNSGQKMLCIWVKSGGGQDGSIGEQMPENYQPGLKCQHLQESDSRG